ncbi:MAG: M12 family metallo-peptidase [Limisphaerales bacterium]
MNNNRLPLLAVFCLLITATLSQAESLLLDAPAPLRAKVVSTSKRQRYVKFNPALLSQLSTPDSQFDLSLFDGELVTLHIDKATVTPGNSNSFVIRCSVPGKPSNYMLLARENGAFTATYRTGNGRLFQIGPASGDLHYLSEVDPSAVATCGVKGKTPPTPIYSTQPSAIAPVLPGTAPSNEARTVSRISANVTAPKPFLDLMVIYTSSAMNNAGGEDAINSQIKLALAEGQDALDNSQANVQLRLVHTELTSYTETGDFNTDLTRLGNPSDGFMDDAIVTRDKYKADILSLWVEQTTGSLAGLAYQLLPGSTIYTYNVIYRPLAVGTYIPVHEIGHNFGCDHEPQYSASNPLYPYAHAYFFQSPDGSQHETVMTAVAHISRRVPHFSNPNVTYDNGFGPVPTGTSSNNNALVINNTTATLTSFRVPPSLGEALDATTINWTTGGDNQWFWQPGTTHDGIDAAQSGKIVDGQTTWMQSTVTGPARLTFWWKCDSEAGADLLIFSIDDVDQNQISGAADWSQQTFFIPSGSHSVRWRYTKDAGGSSGQDAAWVDQVVVQHLKLPAVSITAPLANTRVFIPSMTVTGTAKDDVQVDHVEYQLQNSSGNSGWQTANGKTNWSVPLTLTAGTNTVTARAIGFGQQTSLPVSRSFFYVVTNRLTVTTNGLGKMTPDLNGKFLEIGRRYTITGTPSNNWVFSNWSGTISSNAAVLNFLMQPNMVLAGNFVTNPFIPIKGVYNGLFRESDAVRQSSAGFLTLMLASSGSYVGKMNLDGLSYTLSGKFDLYGNSQLTIARLRTNSVIVAMQLNLATPDDTITGTVSSGSWTSAFTLDRAVFDLVKNKATNFAGKYTLAILGNTEPISAPEGDSYATFTIDNAGMIRASGSMADGTLFSQTVSISKNGVWPLFAPLYASKGMIFSEVTFSNSPASTLGGAATWIKPTMRTALYSNGFTLNTALVGSSFITPSNGVRVLNFTNGTLGFTGANLAQGFTNTVVLNSNNTATVTGPNSTTLLLDRSRGLLTGSHFIAPVTLHFTTFNGVILQNLNEARGYFLGTNQSGSVLLQGD